MLVLTSILGDHKQSIMRCRWLGVPSTIPNLSSLDERPLNWPGGQHLFPHVFPSKKKSHRNWKIETKIKKQALWVFLHLTLPPCQVTWKTREGKIPKIKKEKAPQTNLLHTKKKKIQIIKPPYHPKTHTSAADPFFGGDRKKSCLSKVVTTDLFPEPNLVMDRELPPSEARCPIRSPNKRNLELQKRYGVLCDDFYY